MFQFQLVRLKLSEARRKAVNARVSIPTGAIKIIKRKRPL